MAENRAHGWMAGQSTRVTRRDRGTVLCSSLNRSLTIAACDVGNVPIDMLPGEVLLDIFDFYLCEVYNKMEWKTLVHVCRRWRSIVFAAPLRLDLRLVCTGQTPVRRMLRIWPPLPIIFRLFEFTDEALAALAYRGLIRGIYVYGVSDYRLKSLAESTRHGPFPALTDLHIEAFDGSRS